MPAAAIVSISNEKHICMRLLDTILRNYAPHVPVLVCTFSVCERRVNYVSFARTRETETREMRGELHLRYKDVLCVMLCTK